MCLLLIIFVAYFGYQFLKWVYNRYLTYKIIIPQIANDSNQYKCHVYLEIVHDCHKLIVYCATIAANMHNISFQKDTQVQIAKTHHTCINTYIHLKWTVGYFKLFENIICHFPYIIHIPAHQRWTAIRMLKNDCHVRILIHSDVYYSLHPLVDLPEKSLTKLIQRRSNKLLTPLKNKIKDDIGPRFDNLHLNNVGTGFQEKRLKNQKDSRILTIIQEIDHESDTLTLNYRSMPN